VRIVPQASVFVIERLGKYSRTLEPGIHLLVPVLDTVRSKMDIREQVVGFPPQAVITKDNLVVGIDSVIYYSITDPAAAQYKIENVVTAIEQLVVTTLRNVVGGMQLEEALTGRDHINERLATVLDEATGKWGVKVNRVEIRGIEPPPTIRDAMEQAMRADRGKRAAILTAEGARQSAVLNAEGEKSAVVLNAEADRTATIMRAEADREALLLRAEGEAKAIAWSSTPSSRPASTRRSWPTSASSCCRASRRATPTRSGSCRPTWPASSARRPGRWGCPVTGRPARHRTRRPRVRQRPGRSAGCASP
jgi:regulator of protease activity HflC (stomatin/prohibitin superfamily)